MSEQERTMNSDGDEGTGPQPGTASETSVEAPDFVLYQTVDGPETDPQGRPSSAALQFDFNGARVRTVMRDGETWFVAADVYAVLGHTDPSKAVSRLDDDERWTTNVRTLGGNQQMNVISDGGIYALVLTSRKPQAKAFRRWVFHEILPSIRRTGAYQTGNTAQQTINSAACTFTIPGPGRYVVMALPNGEMNIHQTEYATVVPEITALDCRIMACACITTASFWEKVQELQAIGYDPSSGFAMNELGKAILSGAEIGRHYFYAYDTSTLTTNRQGSYWVPGWW